MNLDCLDAGSAATLLRSLNNLESELSAEANSGERARTLTNRTVAMLKETGITSCGCPSRSVVLSSTSHPGSA